MRWLIDYFRSLFCKHNWKWEEARYNEWASNYYERYKTRDNELRVSATCLTCGYHKSYWKY